MIIAQRLTCVHLNGPRLTLVLRQIIRNYQRLRMKGPLLLSLLAPDCFVVALRQTPARELNRIRSLKHNRRRQRRYGRVKTSLLYDTR